MTKSKLKICHVVSIDITVRFLLMPQLKFLMSQGYSIYAITSKGEWKEEIEKEGIRVEIIKIKRKISPFYDIVSLIKLFLYFKKEKFDIVHTHAPKPGLLGQLSAKLAGVPVIINTIHGLYFTEDSSYFKRKFFILMERIAAKCSTLIFSQNKEDIETMIREKIAKPEKIKYLGNGINIKKFNSERFSEVFISEKKKALRISKDSKIIGTVGRLVQEKGYLDLFEAMKIVLKKYPNTLLLAIGPEEPEKKDKLNKEIVKDYGIENNVKFLGERKDTEELYPIMDIFVLASHREGFPRSVIEAMSCQRPIIVTNIRGCREEIEDGENGIMVQVKKPLELAKAIIFLLENENKAQEFAKNAKIKAISQLDESIVFNRILKAYQDLVKTHIR